LLHSCELIRLNSHLNGCHPDAEGTEAEGICFLLAEVDNAVFKES